MGWVGYYMRSEGVVWFSLILLCKLLWVFDLGLGIGFFLPLVLVGGMSLGVTNSGGYTPLVRGLSPSAFH